MHYFSGNLVWVMVIGLKHRRTLYYSPRYKYMLLLTEELAVFSNVKCILMCLTFEKCMRVSQTSIILVSWIDDFKRDTFEKLISHIQMLAF